MKCKKCVYNIIIFLWPWPFETFNKSLHHFSKTSIKKSQQKKTQKNWEIKRKQWIYLKRRSYILYSFSFFTVLLTICMLYIHWRNKLCVAAFFFFIGRVELSIEHWHCVVRFALTLQLLPLMSKIVSCLTINF